MGVFTTREWALITLTLASVLLLMMMASFRSGMREVIRAFFASRLTIAYCGLAATIALATAAAWRIGIWETKQLGPVLVWTAVGGFPLLFQMEKNSTERQRARRVLLRGLGAAAVAAFLLGMYSYRYVIELLVVSVASFLVLTETLVVSLGTYPRASKWLAWLVAGFGLLLFGDTMRQATIDVLDGDMKWIEQGKAFAIPVWLTAAVLPYTFVLAVTDGYRKLFVRSRLAAKRRITLRERLGAIVGLGIRPLRVGALTGPQHMRFGREADGFGKSRRLIQALYEEAVTPQQLPPHELRAQADLNKATPPVHENTDAYLGDARAYYDEIDIDAMALDTIVRAGQNGDRRVKDGLAEIKDRVVARYQSYRNAGGAASSGTSELVTLIDRADQAFKAGDVHGTAVVRRGVHAVRALLVQDLVDARTE